MQRVPSDSFFAHHGLWAPGVRLFRELHFTAKALIISLAFLVPMFALVGWLVTNDVEQARKERMNATRQHVEIAHGILAWAHEQESSGALTRDAAQALARNSIAALRYDEKEYFFLIDMQPRMVMHPIKPELDGKDLADLKDPNGFPLFQAMADTVRREGKGYIAYQWPKPGSELPVDKISYVQGFEPWGWVVGSGVYTGDLREALMHQLGLVAGVVAVAVVVAGYLFVSFYRVMNGGLKETTRYLRAMTAGDLTSSPAPWGRDEAAQLMLELRTMQESLRHLVLGVRHSSDRIVDSSAEIAAGAVDLSGRSEQAAASLEESSASMEQISSTITSSAELTAQATTVARHNAEVAATGGRAMLDVVRTMDDIQASSVKISEIIGTIDSIAFQTNILALNAAVEAARAGDQGRGFAVVASEVRVLAQRSAEAARQIKALIGSSVDQVRAGAALVQKAGTTIEEIVTTSRQVDELLAQVAISAREQSGGIAQIDEALQELDRMTQQNSTLVGQTAAASAAMKDQATELVREVARFRLPATA